MARVTGQSLGADGEVRNCGVEPRGVQSDRAHRADIARPRCRCAGRKQCAMRQHALFDQRCKASCARFRSAQRSLAIMRRRRSANSNKNISATAGPETKVAKADQTAMLLPK